jgi:hypothetical protein
MNRGLIVLQIGVVLMTTVGPALNAYDFMERPAAILLGEATEELTVGSGGFAQTAYHANVFRDAPTDRFQVATLAAHGIVDVARFRVSAFYGTYMLNGGVNEGDEPGAEAAQWMMNAIQYEYGFILSRDLSRTGLVVLGEYSRRSSHPLRSGFEDPAADVLRLGVGRRSGTVAGSGALTGSWTVRLAWSELYDFWGADKIPDPRAWLTLNLAAEVSMATPWRGVDFFLLAMPDVIVLREGGADMDVALQAGMQLGRESTGVELFLDYYRSGDTEQIPGETNPVQLLGYGIRFTIEG